MLNAIVIGTAPGWAEDLEAAIRVNEVNGDQYDLVAVNRAVFQVAPYVKHFATIHGDQAKTWLQERLHRGGEGSLPFVHSIHPRREYDWKQARTMSMLWGVNHWWPFTLPGGSGLLGVRIALACGYNELYMAGMGLTRPNGDFYGSPEDRQAWNELAQLVPGRVHALRGHAKEIFND
jgi:hypothetical protein